MGWYPFDPNRVGPSQQSDAGLVIDRCHPAHYRIAAAAATVANRYVTSTNMKVGAYTVANATPGDGAAHVVTATRTTVGAADTPGTLAITGTDLSGAVISETINVGANGVVVPTTRAFASVTSVVGAGWVIDEGNDTIVVGFNDALGLPDLLAHNTVMMAVLNNVREAVAPTVTVSATTLALNTVDLNSALNGTAVDVYYVV